ncbi:MAG: hypothetical protein ACI9VR_002695 [Cognaticolwellia sp.]|jgi:hypothetical protein
MAQAMWAGCSLGAQAAVELQASEEDQNGGNGLEGDACAKHAGFTCEYKQAQDELNDRNGEQPGDALSQRLGGGEVDLLKAVGDVHQDAHCRVYEAELVSTAVALCMNISQLLFACSGTVVVDSPTVDTPSDSPADSPVDTPIDTEDPETGDPETGDPETGDPDQPRLIYLLGGQSNMDGWGYVSGLPPTLQLAQKDVDIYWSGRSVWTGLVASASGSSSGVEYFGPEVSFGRAMADGLPDRQVSLIKHAVGGTDLAECWYPGEARDDPGRGPCYRGFVETLDAGLAELDAQGVDYEIGGMVWMQGESDAYNQSFSNVYQSNMERFIERVRQDVETPEMPFAMGQIDCPTCPWRDTVRQAQTDVAAGSDTIFVVATDDLPQNLDNLHFDASGQRTLGRRLGEALLGSATQVATAQPAFAFTGTWASNYTGNFVVGYSFETTETLLITDLGTLDLGWDGLSTGSSVAIWEAESQAILVRATVPAHVSSPSSIWGGWRFVAIEPLELPPGTYMIGSQVYSGSVDRYVHDAEIQAASGVTWLEGRHSNGTGLLFPTNVTSNQGTWFGPNFLFRAVE